MYLSFIKERLMKGKVFSDPNLKSWSLHRIEGNEKGSKSSFSHERRQPSIRVMFGGRSKPRRCVAVPCYTSVIKLSISRFDSQTKSKTSFSYI